MNFNNFNKNNNNSNSRTTSSINTKGEIKTTTANKDHLNSDFCHHENKGSDNYANSTANAETTKNLVKSNSKNTIEKMDEFVKVANPTATARNIKNARMFMFDVNNKSNHNNSANNSKDKYFAILNKKSIYFILKA